jgi:hypothetical protein
MKKIAILIFIISGLVRAGAQNAVPTFTVSPSEIDALTENVTITFDVTGSAVDGLSEVYIWSWSPQINPSEMLLCYEGTSASWGSISPNAKLTPVPGNAKKFKLSLPMTVKRAGVNVTFNNIAELFGVGDQPGKIKEFGFLLRSQDGSKQTPGDMATKVSLMPLEFEASYFRTFPAKISSSDVITAYLNLGLIPTSEDQKLAIAGNFKAGIKLFSTAGQELLAVEGLATSFTNQGEYSVTFLPAMLGTLPTGITVKSVGKCQIVFSGEVLNQNGSVTVVKSKTFEVEFQPYE